MTAVDTNILVRVITRDDKAQSARSRFLGRTGTGLLRQDSPIGGRMGASQQPTSSRGEVLSALRSIVSVDNVEVEDEAGVEQAMSWYERGIDFADSLHMASAGPHRSFVTFDGTLQRRARRLGVGKIALL